MPRNGSGVATQPPGTAGVPNTVIQSTPYNTLTADVYNELTNSLPVTGVKAMAANLPMGGFKVINAADPTLAQDLATKHYVDGVLAAGQIPGTTTNDNAAAGNIGEYIAAISPNTSATITMTIATPCVVTWPSIPYSGASTTGTNWTAPIKFTTTGALATGVVAGTQYWIIGNTIVGNTFQIATSVANALAGTAIATSGSQSGTHTGQSAIVLSTNAAANVAAITLTAGDWDVTGIISFVPANTTSVTVVLGSFSQSSGGLDVTPGRITDPPMGTVVYSGATAIHSPMPTCRLSLAAPTTLYLVAFATFTVAANVGYGMIRARRMR